MNYTESLTDFFKSPKWLNNLLLGGVSMLIPIVGPIALMGWHVTGFWSRQNVSDFTTYPPFDFANFGKYLERGVWPFLVMMVLPVVMMPFMMILMFTLIVPAMIAGGQEPGHVHPVAQGMGIMLFGGVGLLFMAVNVLIMFLYRPLLIGSSITQDFVSAFNWRRLKAFISLTWMEMLVCVLFMWVVGFMLAIGGVLVLIVGMYFTLSIMQFVNAHLDWQLYNLYLVRGGEPIPHSPKLQDGPPPLPPVLT